MKQFCLPSDANQINPKRPKRLSSVKEYSLREEMLLYSPKTEMAFALNCSAQAIWELCDGKRTIVEIGEELGRRFDCSDSELLNDIENSVNQFTNHGLLEPEITSLTDSQ
jgi:hypothetical protein